MKVIEEVPVQQEKSTIAIQRDTALENLRNLIIFWIVTVFLEVLFLDEQTAVAFIGGNAYLVGISNRVIRRDGYILRQGESGSIKNRVEIWNDLQFPIFIQSELSRLGLEFTSDQPFAIEDYVIGKMAQVRNRHLLTEQG